MTFQEFNDLKQRLVDRAHFALKSLGKSITDRPIPGCDKVMSVHLGPVLIIRVFENMVIELDTPHGKRLIYETRKGVELQLNWDEDELANHYRTTLNEIVSRTVLHDLANI